MSVTKPAYGYSSIMVDFSEDFVELSYTFCYARYVFYGSISPGIFLSKSACLKVRFGFLLISGDLVFWYIS